MQLDPMKSKLKAPGTKRLKLNCDELLSTFALKFNLCRCNEVSRELYVIASGVVELTVEDAVNGTGAALLHFSAQRKRFVWDRGCIQGYLGGIEGY